MTKIVDQYGRPIDMGELKEPQTARVSSLENHYLTPMLSGLTPKRLAAILQDADMGNLVAQHRLFSDMEERDGHLAAEMGKRVGAIVGLPWDIVPPRNASKEEKAVTDWVREVLQDGVDSIEELLVAAMGGVGHGFGPVELEWRREDGQFLPAFHPRPQEWFQLNTARTELRLTDSSADGAELQPFGWIMHKPGKPKTGYQARMGLMRTLAWPFLYKAYALGDFAEFLETYGLPLIVGKYGSNATADEKASLLRAVTMLGHDARAIMPLEMQLEVQKVTAGGGESSHLAMMDWADKTESKVILGQTLSADTGSGGGGSFALGKVHDGVRHDIKRGDARQLNATMTRDLVFPLTMLNRTAVTSLSRCPRFILQTEKPEDLASYATNLPPLVKVGLQVPVSWAQEKLHIPMPKKGEAILAFQDDAAPQPGGAKDAAALAALSAQVPSDQPAAPPVAAQTDPLAGEVDQLGAAAAPAWAATVASLTALVDQAPDLATLERSLVDAFGGQAQAELTELMAAAFALATLKGIGDVRDDR